MRFYFTVFAILISSLFFAQNNDSIVSKIKNYKKQDTIRVELLIDACVSGTFDSDKELLSYANEAYQLATKIKYDLGKIRAINCIGNYYFQRGDFKKSINLYFQALTLSEKRNDTDNIIISKSNIANVYTRTKDHQKAIQLLKDCDVIFIQRNQQKSEKRAAILTNLATVYSNIGAHQLSIKTYDLVYKISLEAKSIFGQAITLANLGNEYLKINQIDKALQYSLDGLKIIESNNIDFLKTEIYKILGSIYSKKNDFKNAELFLKKAEILSKKIEDNETLIEVYGKLKDTYVAEGNYKSAFHTLESYIELREKIFGIETKKNADELSTKYETEKKEGQIKALSQQQKISELQSQRKTLILYSSILGFLGILLSLFFFFRKYKINKQNELLKQELQTSNAEKKANESELKALKSQMNPHFIFNALNSIQEQFMFGDKLAANEQMSNFTNLTRQILAVSGKKKISLATEIDILTKYLELEKMRFDSDFKYNISVHENIDDEYVQLPPMLLQPFVENSIKHGLLHKEGEKEIAILFKLDINGNYLICMIEDNGIGRKKSEEIKSKNKHNSFSTTSISQRLQLLNENVNEEEILQYEDLINENGIGIGTRVNIKIYL